MKTLIVYYSLTGNNLILAQYLQKMLGCDVEEIIEKNKRSRLTILLDLVFDRNPAIRPLTARLENYDLVIIVGPIWNERVATPIRTFLKKHRNGFESLAFVSLCIGSAQQEEKIFVQLSEVTHIEPLAVMQLTLSTLTGPHDGPITNLLHYKVKETEMGVFDAALEKFMKKVSGSLPAPAFVSSEYDGIL